MLGLTWSDDSSNIALMRKVIMLEVDHCIYHYKLVACGRWKSLDMRAVFEKICFALNVFVNLLRPMSRSTSTELDTISFLGVVQIGVVDTSSQTAILEGRVHDSVVWLSSCLYGWDAPGLHPTTHGMLYKSYPSPTTRGYKHLQALWN